MALNFGTANPGQHQAADADYPYGRPRDVTLSGDGLGTPWKAANYTEIQGLFQAILEQSGAVPDGNPETALASQYLEGLKTIIASPIYSVSTGSTVNTYGVPSCAAFTVALPGTLVDQQVYRFISHATNPDGGAFTINGKDALVWNFQASATLTPRYKTIRPNMVVEALYDLALDSFIILNPRETIVLHDTFSTAASGTTDTYGIPFTRFSTGRYSLDTGFPAHRGIAQTMDANYVCGYTSGSLYVRDYAGTLTNGATSITLSFHL